MYLSLLLALICLIVIVLAIIGGDTYKANPGQQDASNMSLHRRKRAQKHIVLNHVDVHDGSKKFKDYNDIDNQHKIFCISLKDICYSFIFAAVGFLIGCLIISVLFYALQFIMYISDVDRMRIRAPIAIILLPLVTAFWGYKMGPELLSLIQESFGGAGPWSRTLLIAPVFWALVVVSYIFIFEPFGYAVSAEEWLQTAKIILFPTGVLWSGAWVFAKFVFRP